MPDNSITANRSTLKEFLASVATIKGDLSNITAPPFVLGDYSTVELPQYFADRPSLFVAPALEQDAEKRALLVLKNFLGSLRNQQYAGRREEDGVKKPLNAFLGELFLGNWYDEEVGETKLVCEQVSHHPPVTACYIENEKFGVTAEGFTQQAITFNGNVHIKQSGYAITHIERFDEDYLIPLPSVKVKGVLTGTPYPELEGTYSIVSSTGIISEVKFQGKNMLFGGNKHGFEAQVYHKNQPYETLYTASGHWNGHFSFHDARTGKEIDTFDTMKERTTPITVAPPSEQDPWESRRAWSGVLEALSQGDMKGTVSAKAEVEEGQRTIRHDEEVQSKAWSTLFFQRYERDSLVDRLSGPDHESFSVDSEGGIWKLDREAMKNRRRPYHGDLLPTGQRSKDQGAKSSTPQRQEKEHNGKNGLSRGAEENIDNAIEVKSATSNGVANGDVNGSAHAKVDREGSNHANGIAYQNANGSVNGNVNGDGTVKPELSNAQVENMLRDKYTSTRR
jgi:hypothetical protein